MPADYCQAAAIAWAEGTETARLAGRSLALAIVDADGKAVIGSCDLRRPDPEDTALGEVGYLVSAESRGRGIATRAMWLLIEWGFRELGIGRIQALVHPDNPRSARVLERLGFRTEGHLRHYRPGPRGREDRVLYSILPGELLPSIDDGGAR